MGMALVAAILFFLSSSLASGQDAPACVARFASLSGPTADSLDSFVSALHEAGAKNFVLHSRSPWSDMVTPMIQNQSRAAIERAFDAALTAARSKPVSFASLILYRDRAYPSSYFFSQTHNGWGVMENAPLPLELVGRMPYLEFKDGKWQGYKRGGGQKLRSSFLGAQEKITLYRGVSVQEVELWNALRAIAIAPGAEVRKKDIAQMDALIHGTIRIRGDKKQVVPEAFRKAWDQEKEGVLGKPKKELVRVVMDSWSAEYPTVFTTPDESAARYFMPREPGSGGIVKFELDSKNIPKEAEKGLYVGFENEYFEIGFSDHASRNYLFDSLVEAKPDVWQSAPSPSR